jgi:tetratricopeptide (TPR) repeat protein
LDSGRGNDAIQDFDRALEHQPQDPSILALRGRARVITSRYKEAIEDLKVALEAEPDDVEVLLNRGTAYEGVKSYKDAIKDFSRAIQIDPGSATPEMYYNLGKNYLLDGDLDKAIATLTKVVQMQPTHGLGYANRGVAYKEKGEYAQAVDDFRKATSFLKEPDRLATVSRLLSETEKRIQATRRLAPVPIIPPNTLDAETQPSTEKRLW